MASHLPFRINGPGAATEGDMRVRDTLGGLANPKDAPTVTSIRQPKVEFAQVAHRILLVLPPSPLPIHAQAALKSIRIDLYKTVVSQKWLKAARKVHACDLRELEWTNKGSQGDGVTEDCSNPLTRIVGTTKQPARSLQLDRIRLVLGPWLLSRPVVDLLVLPLTCGGNPRSMAHCSARYWWLTLDLVNGQWETFMRCLVAIGSRRVFLRSWSNIQGSKMGLMEGGQGSALKT